MKKYKVVFIDWNGTLSTSKFWGHLENKDKELFYKIEQTLFGELKSLIKPWMKGEITTEEIIKKISIQVNLDYQTIFDEFVKSCQTMSFVDNKCLKLIEQIRRNGIKVMIATDNMDSFLRWTVPTLKLDSIFDHILDSSTIKSLKNDFDKSNNSLFFDCFIKANKIGKGESVLIDDSVDKDGKIQSYGIDYFRIEAGLGLTPALEQILSDMSDKTSE